MPPSEQPWYRDGLRFHCSRCGNCCRGSGNVWISDDEIAVLARVAGTTEAEFRAARTRRVGRLGVVLRQKRNQDCVFWNAESGCEVYPHRPRQCRTYPFWQGIVHSPDNWEAEREHCPGMGEGERHSAAEVSATAAADGIPPARTRARLGSG